MKNSFTCYLIDDDIDDQEIFEMAIRKVDANADVRLANDGIEGLQILRENRTFVPDFIFLDINMPKMNGIQCLPEIKKLDHLRDSKIVMYSTSSDESVKQATTQLGADGFLVKVPKLSSLVNHLSLILKKGEV